MKPLRLAAAAILVALAPLLVIRPVLVSGPSMEPTFHDGELRFALRAWIAGTPERGQVWVVEGPEGPSLKRILGLPGEALTLEGPHLRVEGRPVAEPWVAHPEMEDQGPFPCGSGYLVMGDNRPLSRDGRIWGPLVRGRLVARVVE